MRSAFFIPQFPLDRGVQLTKEVAYMNMRETAAAAQLDKLWSDTFLTNAGINSALSTGYTYRGAANYDVILDSSQLDKIPTMTGPSSPSGVASASEELGAPYEAWNAMDKNAGASWITNTAVTGWLKYDFGAGNSKTIVKYTVRAEDISGIGNSFKTWTFEGSNNGTDWTVLDTQTNVAAWSNGEIRTYTFSNSTAYRYYRWNVSLNQGGSRVGTNEVTMMEAAATQAVVRSVLITMPAAVTSAIVFADVANGPADLYEISTDNGSTWTTIASANIGKIISVPSGTQIVLRITLSGSKELESWGVATA